MLAELDPARRAGGDDRQLAAVLHAVNELVCFFHDGHIGTEIGIVDLIEAKAAQGHDHFAFYVRADWHTEPFAERRHSRSRLHDNDLFRIVDGVDDLLGIVLSVRAPVGQATIHWPQETQATSLSGISNARSISVSKPRLFAPMTATCRRLAGR